MPVVLIVVPYDGVMAAIFKDGRQKDIKLPILNVWVGVLDTSDVSLTKNAHWICSTFWHSYSVWLMDDHYLTFLLIYTLSYLLKSLCVSIDGSVSVDHVTVYRRSRDQCH